MSLPNREVCIVVLCGLPGSGKTSLSLQIKKWLEELDEITPLILSYDKLMPSSVECELINKQCEPKSKWKIYREAIVSCVHNFITEINTVPNLGINQTLKQWVSKDISKDGQKIDKGSETLLVQFNRLIDEQMIRVKEDKDELGEGNKKIVIIIDDNMYYRSMRYDYYQLARNSFVGFCEVYVACTVVVALQRNSQRAGDLVEPEIITNMEKKFQIPDKSLHSWEKYSITCSTENVQTYRSAILDLIETALQYPVEPIEEIDPEKLAESQKICSSNLVHQADLILRQLISDTMIRHKDSNISKADLKKFGKELADGKSQILHGLRESKITTSITQDEINNSSKDKTNPFFLLVKRKFEELFS